MYDTVLGEIAELKNRELKGKRVDVCSVESYLTF